MCGLCLYRRMAVLPDVNVVVLVKFSRSLLCGRCCRFFACTGNVRCLLAGRVGAEHGVRIGNQMEVDVVLRKLGKVGSTTICHLTLIQFLVSEHTKVLEHVSVAQRRGHIIFSLFGTQNHGI